MPDAFAGIAGAVVLLALLFLGIWLILRHLLPAAWTGAMSLFRRLSSWILHRRIVQQWIAQRRAGVEPYIPILVVAAAGLFVAALAGNVFLDLAETLQEQSPALERADRAVYEWAKYFRGTGVTHVFTAFTVIGTPVGLGAICAGVAAVLFARGRRRWAAYILVTAIGGGLLNVQLKSHFARARPDLSAALRHASGYSFPSGHAMGSTVVAGALSYVAIRGFGRWRDRSLAVSGAITFVIAVAASRVYLGVHWISDIAAGVTAGVVWVMATTVAYEVLRRIRALRARSGE